VPFGAPGGRGCNTAHVSDVEYARTGDGAHVAYRMLHTDVEGVDGTIIMVSGGLIPMEVFEDEPGMTRLLDGLRALGRVVVFDRRGVGLADPILDWNQSVLDQWAEDLAAVVDAVGVRDVVVVSWDGYGVATRFAARHPDRLRMLVLHHPFMIPGDRWDDWVAGRRNLMRQNVDGIADHFIEQIAPSRASDASFRDWYARAGRVGASPTTAAQIWGSVFNTPPSEQLLDQVKAPTLVLHRRDCTYATSDEVQLAASRIEGATLVELDGADHFPFLGDVDAVLAEIGEFVVGERRLPPPERIIAAVMFTDLVASTERAAALGDARWKSVLARHDQAVRAAIGASGGDVINPTGDGVLALLPSAGAAIRVAQRIRDSLTTDGLAVRIGIHVGDVDRRGDDISGLGVHIAARVMKCAAADEVIVTSSVVASVTGEPVALEPLGAHELKGVPGSWELFKVDKHTAPNRR
jgi:pimeloyl-ACP methyl ester carboxylesterase/class 3 adenylate cyclase